MTDRRRELPSVGSLLEDPGVAALMASAPRSAVLRAVREAVDSARRSRAGPPEDWAREIGERLASAVAPSLRPVINATGVVLHTNLGRAPLSAHAIAAMVEAASGYSNLELDLHAGTRGHRADHCRERLAELTGADDALAVNNAAGALLLALNTVASRRKVAISRGELIEIGGSFRIPEILEKSGARLLEVGTTNRTHLGDYENALAHGAAAIVVVHRSNFSQHGFVTTPEVPAIASLAAAANVPLLYDLGSGLAVDLSPFGLEGEPRIQDGVASGAALVIFSGDKLLGGPQAGILAGRREFIAACRRNPLARAVRADKLTLAALDATLASYADPARALEEIPVLAMLTMSADELSRRAANLAAACPEIFAAELVAGSSAVGGGAFPDTRLPTTLVALDPGPIGAAGLALRLRLGAPAVVARVAGDRILLDPRTLPEPPDALVAALAAAAESS